MVSSSSLLLKFFRSKNIFARLLKVLMLIVLVVVVFPLAVMQKLSEGKTLEAILLPVSAVSIYVFLKLIKWHSDWWWDDGLVAKTEKLISKRDLTFSYDNQESLAHYQNFKTFNNSSPQSYSIRGSIDNTKVEYLQIRKFLTPYSVTMITIDRYELGFKHIHITPKNILSIIKSGSDLEWPDYNKLFLNTLKNPSQAREVLTPTFMEALVAMQKKYSSFDVEYFEDPEYQIHALIVLKRGYILPR